MPVSVFVGIDAGGTSIRVLAARGTAEPTHEASLPGANPQREGLARTAELLATAVQGAIDAFPSSPSGAVFVCAGIAGAGRPEEAKELATECRSRLDQVADVRVDVVHDGIVALEGAFSGESGVIIIAGTGSIVLARTHDGEYLRGGGWGYLIGDEGSGYALGAAGVRAVAREMDGGPSTRMTAMLAESDAVDSKESLARLIYRAKTPLQTFAPMVLTAAAEGDAVANEILVNQVTALATQLRELVSNQTQISHQVTLVGGLSQNELFRSQLSATIARTLPGWSVVAPLETPVQGALRLARRMADRD